MYRLCDEIVLERIKDEHYLKFMNQFSQKKWKNSLPSETFLQIMKCTEQHPYYVNALLRAVFLLEKLPTQADVDQAWLELALKKRNDLFHETDSLNITQRKLLVAIANNVNQELTSKNFLSSTKLASSSVIRSLEYLMEEDFIEKGKN